MFSDGAEWDGDGGGESCDYGADENELASRVGKRQSVITTGGGFCDYGADENELASRVGEKRSGMATSGGFCDYGADENELARTKMS